MPKLAVLGLFSYLWASPLPPWLTLSALLPTWLSAFQQQRPFPGARHFLAVPSSRTRRVQPGRWAPCRRAVCRGQRPSVTFLQHPLPPPPPLLNPGFPARLAGAGALVFRGEGGGSVRNLSEGTEGPCSGGFGHFQAPVPTACDVLCQPRAGPTQHLGGHPMEADWALSRGWGQARRPDGARAPPCRVGHTGEMLCFQLAAAEGAGIWEPAHSCHTDSRPRTQTWVCPIPQPRFPRGLRRTAPVPLPTPLIPWLGLAWSNREVNAGGRHPLAGFCWIRVCGVCA